MNKNESTLKALSLIAAELHIQNHINLALIKGFKPGYSYLSQILVPEPANHFKAYFEGEMFSPGSIMDLSFNPKDKSVSVDTEKLKRRKKYQQSSSSVDGGTT